MALSLKKFDMTTIKHDSVVALIGMRNTGKSFLVKDLLEHQPNLPATAGTVISGANDVRQEYSIPNFDIHDEYSPLIISNVLNRQKLMADQSISTEDRHAVLVLDDCIYDNEWVRDTNIRDLFINRRHNNTLFIITMLYGMCIPPPLNKNIDYVFILRESIISNRRRLYEYYAGGVFPDFDLFCKAMNQYAAEEFVCLVIDNTTSSTNWDDKVFWYKAEPHPAAAAAAVAVAPRRLFSVTCSKSNVRPRSNEASESAPQEVRHGQNQA